MTSTPAKTDDERREPTCREREAIEIASAKVDARPSRVAYTEEEGADGVLRIASKHSDDVGASKQMLDAFGTSSDDFMNRSVLHLANMTSTKGKAGDVAALNGDLALMGAIAPENELEAAIAVQMASMHELSLDLMRRAKKAETVEGLKTYTNLASKTVRTFSEQVKTLSDLRRGGEQVVRHVHVYEGGQAVVADTFNYVGIAGNGNAAFNPHGQGPRGPAMLGTYPTRHPLPMPSYEGAHTLPDTWRGNEGRGSAEREPERVEARRTVEGDGATDCDDAGDTTAGG